MFARITDGSGQAGASTISSDEITAQLDAVLNSRRFANSHRASALLRFVVEQSVAGKASEIKESMIGVAVFDRSPDYDPGADPVVRVRAGRVRSLLEEYYLHEGRLDPIRIEVPKGAYQPTFHRQSPPSQVMSRPRKWWIPVLLSISGAILVLAISTLVLRKPTGMPSIAVLPFLNLTGNASDEVLVDGLAEELTTVLAQSKDCRVAARSSAFQFRGNRDVRSIGEQLGTRFVIEGSVRREGERLIVTAQVIETGTGYHLYAGKFERPVDEAYAIPGEIGRTTLTAVGLGPAPHAGIAPGKAPLPEAYALYLQGRYVQNQKGGGTRRAMEYYRRAAALDPNYAQAYGALALSHARFTFHQSGNPAEDARLARENALRAIHLVEQTPEAHLALALAAYWRDWNWAEAEPHFRRALEILPGYGFGHQAYALGLMTRRRFEDSIIESRRALDLDPLSYAVSNDLATALYAGRRFDESIQRADQVLAIAPNFFYARLIKGSALAAKGNYHEAVGEFRQVTAAAGNVEGVLGRLAMACALAGLRGEADKARAAMDATPLQERSGIYRAMAQIPLGDRDQVFVYLNKAVESRETDILFLDADPIWDPVRSDPRFLAIRKRVGLD
ncbi:MAG: hypothetical protein HY820_30320 [Acidobacteria bacterium]|nr:hypothetical protein [Acidobacteriota bacterium]